MKMRSTLIMLIAALGLVWAGAAFAAQVNPPASAFSVVGYIQEATLANVGSVVPNARLMGGTLTVNGIKMIVPNNSIVQTPAGTFSWADLFDPAVSQSIGYNPPRPNHRVGVTGLALADNPLEGTRSVTAASSMGYPAFAVSVVGNIVNNQATGTEQYIVGLIVPAEQLPLMGGAGLINFIDYAGTVLPGHIPGRFRVGGTLNDPNSGTLCEINDPVGRFGAAHSPDPRFTCDTDNPTIVAASGYPVGIPTVAPPGIDPDRPDYNRPVNGSTFGTDPFTALGDPLRSFTMPVKVAPNAPGDTTPDPWKQVPLKVGDWIDYGGTLFKIDPIGPNTAANMFVSIHTISAHLGIRTVLGTQPSYIAVESFIFGVGDRAGGPTVSAGNPATPIAQETSTRVSMVSFTTDTDPNLLQGNPALPNAQIMGIDTQFGSGFPVFPVFDPTQFSMDDPIRGRIRFQDASNNVKPPVPGTLYNATGPGNFYRMYRVQLTHGGALVPLLQLPPQSNGLPGLITGQFSLPIFEYLFGEGSTFGQPIPPFNFWNFGFLTTGDGTYGPGGPQIGPLDPFPGPITQPAAPKLGAPAKGAATSLGTANTRSARTGTRRR